MAMCKRKSAVVLAAFSMLSVLPAHGGQYSGPLVPAPVFPVRVPVGGPVTGAPGGPKLPKAPAGAAVTGVRLASPTTPQWEQWWEFNKEPFLLQRTLVETPPVTGSDDFYLGQRRSEDVFDTLEPTDEDLRDRIVPALGKMIERNRNRDIVTACLIGLGKIGRDGPGVDLEAVLADQIKRDDQEVRETAVLSIGVAGRRQAMPILAALLRDDKEGRRLENRAKVKDRTRAFAAYGIGVLARRIEDIECKREAHDLLLTVIEDRKENDRDMRVAALSAMGILGLDASKASHKRLLWQTVDELFAFLDLDLGRGDENVQAHAPIAIARLMGRGDSYLHQRSKERFAELLTARKKRRSHPILRSAVIALGMMARPEEQHPPDAPMAQALRYAYGKSRDQYTKNFALMSLGRIGGARNRDYLLQVYQRGSKRTERPWAALALGVHTFADGCVGTPDETVSRILVEDLLETNDRSLRGALSIAVGLTGYPAAGPSVLQLLRDSEADQRSSGHLCIALALLGERSATPFLSSMLARSLRRPFLLDKCARALGRLGDRGASVRLAELMQKNDSVAVLAALATAIGRIGDRRSIDPLLGMLGDGELTKLARAFVAAALGGIGDKDEMPWNVPLSVDSNYASSVDTLTNGMTGVLDIL